ncbi:hypothetical protein [Chryseobacterium potabilaquae]|uniref:Uncharacterized protein n=1 Tax=Chryseobacterium potabilaquae TaxID=2675057 RepID=A0A6N4XC45_9FLAO|nr:hypothetical protein [Chryseobacterium potabilaquae]CAA7197232.1 hypothetical protein CHRY9293_03285 [Chryseobacterium potabilaquae]
MLELFEELPDLYKTLLSSGGGLFVGWIATYVNEKAKQKALKNENKNLVEETENIKSHYTEKLEEIKKDHQLEIAKRKYQYESKKDIYITFFKLLDTFNSEQSFSSQERIKEIIEEFNRNFTNAKTTKAQQNASIVFTKKLQAMSLDSNKDLIKLKQETNSIRLLASDEVIAKLDCLDEGYDLAMKESDHLLISMPKLIMKNDEEEMAEYKKKIQIHGQLIESIKKELIELMRKELTEI